MEVVYFQYKNGCGQIQFSLFLLNVLIIPLMVMQTALIVQDWVLNLSGVELCKIDANKRHSSCWFLKCAFFWAMNLQYGSNTSYRYLNFSVWFTLRKCCNKRIEQTTLTRCRAQPNMSTGQQPVLPLLCVFSHLLLPIHPDLVFSCLRPFTQGTAISFALPRASSHILS